jgi:hypothetical protein
MNVKKNCQGRKSQTMMEKMIGGGKTAASSTHSTESGVVVFTASTWPLSVSANAMRKT